MAQKRESARETVILAIVAAVLGFYVVIFGLPTLVYFEAHRWAANEPYLNEVPLPLPTTTASQAATGDLSFYGFQFAAPWKKITEKKEGPWFSVLDFQSGAVLLFFNPVAQEDTVGQIRSGNPEVYRRYADIFGVNIFPTNYAMYQAVYGASPGATSPFLSRQEAVRMSTLLLWKLEFGTSGARAIYSIQSGEKQGFQFGDPSLRPFVVLRLFDEHNNQMELLFASKSGQPGTISQADINCVVDSIQPVRLHK